ncbi:MAG: glycoside hydrolase family 43 protein [Lachnospiraceae bacterium]|nr:glycoside hydrolase family 43 protein [Lachnospiraceae bacterium]
MQYTNPILPGFHPDPSICRVGEDFYLVTSTFEYFPGLPIYHSRDLVTWEQIGHVLTRDSQVKLPKGAPNCLGIYAPTIRYHEGVYYCIVTNVAPPENINFIVTATDPAGEWSDPIRLPFGGIDPSLFFDDDGRVYYTGTDSGVFICEINVETGEAIGEKQYAWNGTGANNPEGPHLYKINGYYYLMIAEGGTELGHMTTIARAKVVLGPYESCPHNPILTNRGTELPIKAIGHADLFTDVNGNWWAVCLGNRPLSYPFRHNMGRETMLVPVEWKNGWPVCGNNGHVEESISVDRVVEKKTQHMLMGNEAGCMSDETAKNIGANEGVNGVRDWHYIAGSDVTDKFNTTDLHPSWNYIYHPTGNLVEPTKDGVLLHGNQYALNEDESKALICRRQEHFDFAATVKLSLLNSTDEGEVGISVYMNPRHHYEAALTVVNGMCSIVLKRQIGSLKATEVVIPYTDNTVTLRLEGSKEVYRFSYSVDGESYLPIGEGEAQYLTTEVGGCFTGNYIALYAAKHAEARLESFTYKACR